MNGISIRLVAGIILIAIVLLYGLVGLNNIELGEVGLRVRMLGMGRGSTEMLPPGTRWVDPIMNDVFIYDARLKQYDLPGAPASTKDGQPIKVDLSVELGLIGGEIPTLHQNIGRSYYDQVVYPAIRSTLRNTTTEELSDEIYTGEGRKHIQDTMEERLRDKLMEMGFRISVNLREIVFTNEDFVGLLENKAKAQQKVEIERRNAEAAVNIAKRKANIAEGEKQARIKAAEAQKEEIRLKGLGERLAKEQEAKGNLALYKAEAEGTRLQVNAYGSGRTYASVQWAKNMGPNVKVYGIPTGSPGSSAIMDLNGILKGAFTGTSKVATE